MVLPQNLRVTVYVVLVSLMFVPTCSSHGSVSQSPCLCFTVIPLSLSFALPLSLFLCPSLFPSLYLLLSHSNTLYRCLWLSPVCGERTELHGTLAPLSWKDASRPGIQTLAQGPAAAFHNSPLSLSQVHVCQQALLVSNLNQVFVCLLSLLIKRKRSGRR